MIMIMMVHIWARSLMRSMLEDRVAKTRLERLDKLPKDGGKLRCLAGCAQDTLMISWR